MARDRLRDPGLIERQRTQARIASDIGIGGRVKVGNVGGGGGGFAALTPPAIGRGNRIEHVTLHAEESQTIASGGAGVTWDRIAAAPTELRGFASLIDDLADTGAVVAIPADITGLRKWFAHLIFARDITATVTISRLRNGVQTIIDEYEGTGNQWIDGSSLQIRNGDTTTITITTDADVTVTWGRIFVDDFGTAGPTTPDPTTVYEQTTAWTSGGDWPDADAMFIWTRPDGNHPVSDVSYMAQRFYLASAATVRVWASIDNEGSVYVDGTLLLTDTDSGTSALGNVKDTVSLAAGWHTVAVEATNNAGFGGAETPAGARIAVYTYVGGADDQLLVHTDLDWHGWTSEPVGWADPSLSGG